jgi:hypothetical protein
MVVDHWIKGPHHTWVDMEGNQVRTYHAWFAMGVWTNHREIDSNAVSVIQSGPRALSEACVSADFPGDLYCGPTDRDGQSAATRHADTGYVSRANEWVPRPEYTGDNFESMTSVLNIHLKQLLADSAVHRECAEFTNDELNDIMQLIHAARDPALQVIYEGADDPRSLHGNLPAGASTDDLEDRWAQEKALLASAPELEEMMRDGKCHETVMWFVHHLSLDAQIEIGEMVNLPLLPAMRHFIEGPASTASASDIENIYETQVTCLDCHLLPGVLINELLDDEIRRNAGGQKDVDDRKGIYITVGVLSGVGVIVVGTALYKRHRHSHRAMRGSRLVEQSLVERPPGCATPVKTSGGKSKHKAKQSTLVNIDSAYSEIASV